MRPEERDVAESERRIWNANVERWDDRTGGTYRFLRNRIAPTQELLFALLGATLLAGRLAMIPATNGASA